LLFTPLGYPGLPLSLAALSTSATISMYTAPARKKMKKVQKVDLF
jgi:hypothetical protein